MDPETPISQKQLLSRKVAELIDRLPPLPETIAELRKVAANPNARFSHIVPVLKKDPPMCADLLHLVNSAYFGVNHTVEDVGEALRIFGVEPLINFVTLTFSEKAIRKYFAEIKNLGDYFKHSRQISKAAAIVAKKARKSKQTQDFLSTAGLLHDIGRLVIMLAQDKKSFELAGNSLDQLQGVIKDEQDILGMNHCIIGSSICEKWCLSKLLRETIQLHHTPLEGGLHVEACLVFLAHFITFEEVSDMMLVSTILPQDTITALGLTPKSLIAARRDYENVLKKLKD
jgi:HD-like signal output (HDOD) protein